jgi:uncharacterized membrane protein YGL010W
LDSASAPLTADDWADRFGELRLTGAGAVSAWLGIPLVVAALVGMLWAAPIPSALHAGSPGINAATMFLMATFVYYCVLSIRLALGALALLVVVALPSAWLAGAGLPVWPIASAVFAPAFCWQLLETKRATGSLRVLANLQYLMLGPFWLTREAFRRLGLAY